MSLFRRRRYTEDRDAPQIPRQRSLDCRDGQHCGCIPRLRLEQALPPCSCSCHIEGDPAERACAVAGWSPDPRPQLAADIDQST